MHTALSITETTSKLKKESIIAQNYRRAMDIYDELIKRNENQNSESLSNIYVFKACCLYALCMYKEAKAECEKAVDDSPLKMRLFFQLA